MALTDTPICDFGWNAAHFHLSDPNGVMHSVDQVMGTNGLLVAFICNHCPYVKAIANDFAKDAEMLKSIGVGVVAIMPNDYLTYPDDSPTKMLEFASKHNFDFPYLIDQSQSVAKAYGAVCTPDFFGFNSSYELQYRGRLDNLGVNKSGEREPDLVNAMSLVAKSSRGPNTQVASIGCSIKWRG